MDPVDVARLRAAVKRLAAGRPGQAVELRIPPYIAVQLGSPDGGPVHRRGTPPAVVEMTGPTFLALIDGQTTWAEALADHLISASGAHADLGGLFASPNT